MPKRLLRSVIEFDQEVSPGNLTLNFQKLRKAIDSGQFVWGRSEDDSIYKYTQTFFTEFFEVPSAQTVLDHFKSSNSIEEIERLKDIQVERPYARTNFVHLLHSLQEDQAKVKAFELLRETHLILTKGLEDKKAGTTKKGLEEAILHFTKQAQDIRIVDTDVKIRGDIREDGKIMREEYEYAERNKGKVFGVLSGIEEIDEVCKGAKKGELWIHAAFPSELKTTLAVNWCYNAVTKFRKNVVYVSFEMPRDQVRRNVYSLHTSHNKFAKQGYSPIDYRSIRDGTMTAKEKEFFNDIVIPDFTNNENYTHFEVITPDREWNMDDVRAELEAIHKELEVGLVVLDHGQWIEAKKTKKNKDYTIELNSVITDAKRLALHFDHNSGVPVLMLFQINRNGKTEADKNEGVYKMNALTYANNAEKTADVITTTYLSDDMRKNGRTKFTNLKNRDNPKFEPFEANVYWPCRQITSARRAAPRLFQAVDEHADCMSDVLEVAL